ncbi:MAG: hypothetical protein KAR33_03405 [Candidatus Thorarchaeota archaeon]|nr:hypothetical protein [Candidatus Thorarchaeota archaeon]
MEHSLNVVARAILGLSKELYLRLNPLLWVLVLKAATRFKTFVSEQKMLLFTQIAILMGLVIEIGIFFSLLWWGRPPAIEYALVFQFYWTLALWVIIINMGIILFWWVSSLGPWSITLDEDEIVTQGDED